MPRIATVSTSNLNQWAMDFKGNKKRIIQSIQHAKDAGARFRSGPELEITGYSCMDHFLEMDTIDHSWASLAQILESGVTDDILCDIGMPVIHRNMRFNSRVFCHDGKIVGIRPKISLAQEGHYREMRWFTGWGKPKEMEEFHLPKEIADLCGFATVPIGDIVFDLKDTSVASETCEDLWTPQSPHIELSLDGVEIISNGSGSHHQMRKLDKRVHLVTSAVSKCGGVYLYANQQGCDGDRLYFDGGSLIACNDAVVAQASQFSISDVESIHATVDLDEVMSYRSFIVSRSIQGSHTPSFPRVKVDFEMVDQSVGASVALTPGRPVKYHSVNEEIAMGPALWCWDYLVRSGMDGYFLPLSGGADSASTAAIIGSMCQLAVKSAHEGNEKVQADVRRLMKFDSDDDESLPQTSQELCENVLYTAFMGTENNSKETEDRAARIAKEIGATHTSLRIDSVVDSLIGAIDGPMNGHVAKFKAFGGTERENLALQNVQARSRMVISYLLGQLWPWAKGKPGNLLVLGSSNVDESITGYMTKYDCSSADLNPIGGISKTDLKVFLNWAAENLGYETLAEIAAAKPTAELEPITDDYVQTDEEDMGLSYEELRVFGSLRKVSRLGPVSMFTRLMGPGVDAKALAEKIKMFFKRYAINRHKMTTITPAYHAEMYSPLESFDQRQFLYNSKWEVQFEEIDRLVEESERE